MPHLLQKANCNLACLCTNNANTSEPESRQHCYLSKKISLANNCTTNKQDTKHCTLFVIGDRGTSGIKALIGSQEP